MAFNDTLFQLGMDLTRSSTAQKEDHARAAFSEDVADRVCDPVVEHSVRTIGTTICIDLVGARRLDDVKSAERAIRHAIDTLGLKLKSLHLDRVAVGGVSGVALLSSGHLTVRACSRTRTAAIDLRGCVGPTPGTALIAIADACEASEGVIRRARKAETLVFPDLRVVSKTGRRERKPKAVAKAA